MMSVDKKSGSEPESDSLEWILETTKNPPKTKGGDESEDLKEYDFDDI
jgi:hypothetical protein